MATKNELILNPTQWLGNANIMAMDWDCRAMLMHLILLSAQQETPGYLPLNETLLRKVLENPNPDDWEKRIRPQILSVLKTKNMEVNNIHGEYLYYPDYIKALDVANGVVEAPVKKTRKKKIKNDVGVELLDNENFFQGFSLDTIIKAKATTTILFEKTTENISKTIWDVGVSVLLPQKGDEASCRKLLGRLIKLYGAPSVSAAIAEISAKNLQPANMEGFLIGVIKGKVQELEGTTTPDGQPKPLAPQKTTKQRPTNFAAHRTITGKVAL